VLWLLALLAAVQVRAQVEYVDPTIGNGPNPYPLRSRRARSLRQFILYPQSRL
jgi:hypothetical protein